jgi:small conductance mechanosensitive channel
MDGLSEPVSTWVSTTAVPALVGWVPLLLRAIVVLLITLYLRHRAGDAFTRTATRAMDPHSAVLGARLIRLGVLALGLTLFLDTVGVPPSTLIAAIGVIGLAISLALQDILRNFFSGVYLLFERPFLIGDTVRIKEHEGVVEHVGFRTMVLKTADDARVLIPNSLVIAEVVSNRTRVTQPPPAPNGGGHPAAQQPGSSV